MKRPQLYSSICTAIIGSGIVLLLLFLYMPYNDSREDEGVMISFGDEIEGFGETPEQQAETSPETAEPEPSDEQKVEEEELMSQEEESVDLSQQKEKQEQERIKQEQKRQQEIQAQKLEQERLLAEQQRKAEQEAKTAKATGAAAVFGNKIGVGQKTGSGTAGNPAGKGTSNGNSWSLSGRDLNGELKRPFYNSNQEGKVIVEIKVNEQGYVVSASVAPGTTITDKTLREEAVSAAKKTSFSQGQNVTIGTITYYFKLM